MPLSIFNRAKPLAWRPASDKTCELPQVQAGTHETTRHLLNVAGGLALVLSRCNEREIDREYPNAAELYRLLKHDLKRYGRTSATAELMLEASHEVSERLDPVSRHSLRASLEARRVHDRRKESAPAPLVVAPSEHEAMSGKGYEVIESDDVAEFGDQLLARPAAA